MVYNSDMENIQENILEPFINLNGLLQERVNQQSKADFLTFVRMMAPMLVSDWRMGRHIEVISNKLKDLEEGEIDIEEILEFIKNEKIN